MGTKPRVHRESGLPKSVGPKVIKIILCPAKEGKVQKPHGTPNLTSVRCYRVTLALLWTSTWQPIACSLKVNSPCCASASPTWTSASAARFPIVTKLFLPPSHSFRYLLTPAKRQEHSLTNASFLQIESYCIQWHAPWLGCTLSHQVALKPFLRLDRPLWLQ